MPKKQITVSITGAAGQIGYALLFRIAQGEMFGPNTFVHLRLLELPQAFGALRGVSMELSDCAFPLLKQVTVTSDLKTAFDQADWALLIGSFPRKAGMERKELLSINGKIFLEQGKALDKSAKKDCKVLVVGNPCNTNAYIAKSVCKNIPEKNFFAMTMLDETRARCALAQKAAVPVTSVSNVGIWGNHSLTQYPDFYHAKIKGKPALDVLKDEQWLREDFIKDVQTRGAQIIEARGVSSAASAANAVIKTVKQLSLPTKKGEFFSVAVSSDGSYQIPKGIMFSFPVAMQAKTWRIVKGIKHNDFAKEKIKRSLDELLEEKRTIESAW